MDRRVLLFSIACVVITWFSIYDSNHAAYCQSAVYDMGIAAGHSIIRNYRPGIDIVFLNDKTDSGFCYVERSTNTKRFFNIPAPINVIDFTIYGRYVFFCGTMNSKAIVGSFDISSVFFSGGYFNYCLLPNNNNGYQNTPDSIMSLYCIKTYTVDDELHLVMLGKGNSSTSNSKVQSMDCVVDAWSNNLSNWVFHYLMDTADAFRYTDIAVTDNYVIIASYHNDPSINSWAYTYWPYSRPSTTGNSIFISHLFSGNTINAPYFMTDYIRFFCNNDEKVLATPMGGNRFATACGAKVPYFQSQSNQATVVCVYNNSNSTPTIHAFEIGNTKNYTELVYNSVNQKLYLLPKNNTDTLYEYDLGTNQCNAIISSYMNCRSMDVENRGQCVVLTGPKRLYNKESLWVYDNQSYNTCSDITQVVVDSIPDASAFFKPLMDFYRNTFTLQKHTVNATLSEIIKICY